MNIHEALKYHRTKAGLVQKQVADMLPTKPGTYQAYEHGRAEPSLATLIRLKEIYGLPSIEALLRQDEKQGCRAPWELRYHKLSKREKMVVDMLIGGPA